MQKYNEKTTVPFSGYLNKVLTKWPYSLGEVYLGKKLSTFQRDMSRVKTMLTTDVDLQPSIENIREKMITKYPDFDLLNEKLKEYLKSVASVSLHYGEKDIERPQVALNTSNLSKRREEDMRTRSRLSKAILESYLETKDQKSFLQALACLKNPILLQEMKLSPQFKQALKEKLKW